MLGAIYVGLSGLRTYSDGLEKISNNVSNLNSLGFKASSVTFTNVQNARDSGGTALHDGGREAGGGVGLAGSTIDFKPGDLRQTDNDLDLAVDGTGLLVLLKGTETRFTRTGSFQVDPDGYIVLAGTEWRLATLDPSGQAVAVTIDASRTSAPVATQRITFTDNLSSTANDLVLSDLNVIDANGTNHKWKVAFKRQDGSSDWTLTVTDDKSRTIGTHTLNFAGGAPTAASAQVVLADADNGLSVTLDFASNVTSFSSASISTLRAASIDGHAAGQITTVAVNAKGELELAYSNGEKAQLGAIALASFRDASQLKQESAGLFSLQAGAQATLMASDDTRVGTVLSRRLEASNVDLSKEFGDLILVQRGFQASSQIVSASNEMIQQLFGIRGQG